ncbi:uncharacterized protein N7496_002281 [Penicillium cataractarum]|uniref:Major facilitator superfamily (MFS) profile domain-containing protein n=1 Tax=Penicillium cataractarum TaxID=2100454 RepID=A0A9W9VF54_9EURO|nr:uncharacterized protein N7496_002281 [Penicillium cataractarum]KAJ5379853.1 hypothetical protein N7496_002281 [Penicillium cataractarum]
METSVRNEMAQEHPDYRKLHNNTNKDWWKDPGLRINVYHCAGLCGAIFFNGFDGSLFNGLQTIPAWLEFFDYPSSNKLGLMNSAALFPGLVAPYFSERIATKWGRRYAIWLGIVINVIGAIVNSASTGLGMYIAGRVIMGIGIATTLTIASTLLQEIAHPRYRAPLGTIYTSIYYVAAVISAGICLGTRNIAGNASWRIPCYLQLIGPIATFIMTWTMPESPRWLIKNERYEEAIQILAKYHANGDINDPLVQLEHREIMQGIEAEQINSQVAYTDFLKPKNHHRLFLLVIIAIGTNWVGNGIVSYYLSPILNQVGVTAKSQQATLNLGLQVWNLILSTTAGLNCDRIGRRPMWLISNIGMLCAFAIVMGLSGSYATTNSKSTGLAVIPFLFIYFGFYVFSWTPLANMYSVEILPFNLRAKGQAIFVTVQNAANAVNQWVNPIILEAIHWKYYGVYIGILMAYIVMIWFTFPETKGLTIEEVATVFDGEDALGMDKGTGKGVAKTATASENLSDSEHVEQV